MAFDQNTRNRLARLVGDARALLTEEFTRQLQREYGLDPASGDVADLETALSHLDDARRATAQLLRDTAEHYQPGFQRSPARERRETLDRIVREQAFTVLNRLCALRMAEARGLLLESVGRGQQSRGFQLYTRVAGAALGETGEAYCSYLFSLFDELAVDLPVLFDRFAPEGRLFPGEAALLGLLGLINHPEVEGLWAEDETIGWIYQYFNSQEERRQMRAESSAPRNSRELAVRNQFFTPRYVVEFLADNTLGRIWYEMTKGATGLVDSCRYLVRRPSEIFLSSGQQPPAQVEPADGLSQEELLRQPVYISHRPLKDPRGILMLDPACGSMHFGLYAFDLFERIYEEAWDLEAARGTKAFERPVGLAPLHETYADREAFLREVPRLIVERNIHGVDIDPRAAQIAALALWLRAQRSWRDQGVKALDRPAIRRSNVVCAEPMPGDQAMLDEFIGRQLEGSAEDRVVGQMLRRVFAAMQLAGEAGSLLKIEEEIAAIVAEGKKAWMRGPRYQQGSFFADTAAQVMQRSLDLDATGVTDETFWSRAEGRVIDALRTYAEDAEGGAGYRRRLFADDAAQGFAFIDLCRRRYDVVLMNPPFGAASASWKPTFEKAYLRTKNDLYAAFVERGVAVLRQQGMLGAITSRTGFFLTSFQKWREEILLGAASPTVVADLGGGVLDAMVETAAYCLCREERGDTIFFRLLDTNDKAGALFEALANGVRCRVFDTKPQSFVQVPGTPFAYWASAKIRHLFTSCVDFNKKDREIWIGLQTNFDFRWVRLFWEVKAERIRNRWYPFAKGGAYSKYTSNIHLLVEWEKDGARIKSWKLSELERGRITANNSKCWNESRYFRLGLTWSRRSQLGISLRILPEESVFADKGPAIFVKGDDRSELLALMGVLNSSFYSSLLELQMAFGSYEAGVLQRTPVPDLDNAAGTRLGEQVLACVELKRNLDRANETSHAFHLPALLQVDGYTIAERMAARRQRISEAEGQLAAHQHEIDDIAFKLYDIEGEDRRAIEEGLGAQGPTESEAADAEDEGESETSADAPSLVTALVSYLAGLLFGRWDIRYATGERRTPELPDPFAPLPACPPGMLQNAQGLPAAPEDVPVTYPLRISWPGILVDDEGHREDIEGRVREALQAIWGGRAEAIEQEACEILGVKTLREYFRKPGLFFAEHVARYSKSRRQAPIYWPLSMGSNYTIWLYYHRLTDQTLYSCVNDFIEPKLAQVGEELARLHQKPNRGRGEERELEQLRDLEAELRDLRAELLRVAAFWKPNLNDGVQITAAPLWRLFQHKPWQKKLKETWESLERGDYDWAHLAYSIWPERVCEKCKTDKSLAIAHGLEELYVEAPAAAKKGRGRGKKTGAEGGGMFEEE